ncbi:MAG: type IV pilus assembly protein PilM [Planctomycetota bacterium]
MFKKKNSVVGLDLGTHCMKAVEVSLEGQEPLVTGFSMVEVAPDSDRSAKLAELLSAARFNSKRVVTSVAGQAVVVRYISMVQMSDAELKEAVRFESEKYLPFDPEDVVMDCQRLQNGSGESAEGDQVPVVLVACQRGAVDSLVQDLSKNGLSPEAVDVDVFALSNCWELASAATDMGEYSTEEVATSLVEVGASRTQINVQRGGETCFSREVGIGGSDMTKAIARRLGLDFEEAEALKCDPGERDLEVRRAIGPVLEDLVSELGLSLDFVENREGVRVERVLLSGGGVLAPGCIEFVEQATGRTATTWNPLDAVQVDSDRVDLERLESFASSLAVAIGLATREVTR